MKTTSESCPRLIEVALPIREISAESVRDKSLRHGHISTLHLWCARRLRSPLPRKTRRPRPARSNDHRR